jgi:hypothetical protein
MERLAVAAAPPLMQGKIIPSAIGSFLNFGHSSTPSLISNSLFRLVPVGSGRLTVPTLKLLA